MPFFFHKLRSGGAIIIVAVVVKGVQMSSWISGVRIFIQPNYKNLGLKVGGRHKTSEVVQS